MKCTYCRQELAVGLHVLQVIQGVIGMRDFIPLEHLIFCSERCVVQYYRDPTIDDAVGFR